MKSVERWKHENVKRNPNFEPDVAQIDRIVTNA